MKILFMKDTLAEYNPRPLWSGLVNSYHVLLQTCYRLLAFKSVLNSIFFLAGIFVLIKVGQQVKTAYQAKRLGSDFDSKSVFAFFTLVTLACNLGAVIVTGRMLIPVLELRYLMFPIVMIFWFEILWTKTIFTSKNLVIQHVIVFLITTLAWMNLSTFTGRQNKLSQVWKHETSWYELRACLQQFQKQVPLQLGVSGYWQTKILRLLGKPEFTLVPYTSELKRFRWLYGKEDVDDPESHQLNFVVLDGWLRKEGVLKQLGKPDREYTCQIHGPLYNGYHTGQINQVEIYYYSQALHQLGG
jgi:hypothetical protein